MATKAWIAKQKRREARLAALPKFAATSRSRRTSPPWRSFRDSSPTRSHNRCLITGCSKAVYRKFKVSRIMLRELALAGRIPGMKKASW